MPQLYLHLQNNIIEECNKLPLAQGFMFSQDGGPDHTANVGAYWPFNSRQNGIPAISSDLTPLDFFL